MNKRKSVQSIRLKSTFFYLLKMSGIVLPIILFFSLLFFWATHVVVKGVFAFYAIEILWFYIYMICVIYNMEREEYTIIANEITTLTDEECKDILLHQDNNCKAIIPFKNVGLMWEIAETYAFLDKSEWKKLYYHLLSNKEERKKAFIVNFDCEHADVSKLKKYYACQNGVFYLM